MNWLEPTAEHEHEDRWFGLHWKTRTLVEWVSERPFIWVDDEITDADRGWVLTHHHGRAQVETGGQELNILRSMVPTFR